jgi:hypothetical protein
MLQLTFNHRVRDSLRGARRKWRMKHRALALAVCCLALFLAVVLWAMRTGAEGESNHFTPRQAELRYRQSLPRHWHSVLLQQP